jgi:hypothetical protein
MKVAISSSHHPREAQEVHRLERRAYQNTATENVLNNTNTNVHNDYYSRQITRVF